MLKILAPNLAARNVLDVDRDPRPEFDGAMKSVLLRGHPCLITAVWFPFISFHNNNSERNLPRTTSHTCFYIEVNAHTDAPVFKGNSNNYTTRRARLVGPPSNYIDQFIQHSGRAFSL